jgi:hypothetical protein
MAASGTTILRGKALLASAETKIAEAKIGEGFESLPLPWPAAGISAREARRPHGHRCIICNEHYRCAGPDSTGECAPLCAPCLWVELGAQLRTYQSMADEIDRRRKKLEDQVGAAKCRKAQTRRLSRLRVSNVVAGFGRVALTRAQRADHDDNQEELESLRIDRCAESF